MAGDAPDARTIFPPLFPNSIPTLLPKELKLVNGDFSPWFFLPSIPTLLPKELKLVNRDFSPWIFLPMNSTPQNLSAFSRRGLKEIFPRHFFPHRRCQSNASLKGLNALVVAFLVQGPPTPTGMVIARLLFDDLREPAILSEMEPMLLCPFGLSDEST